MLVLAIAGFVGFEATVVLSEEAKDPKRTIARATHWAVILRRPALRPVGVGDVGEHRADQIVAAAQEQQTDLVFALVAPHVPAILVQHRLHAVPDQRVRRPARVPRRGGPLPVRPRAARACCPRPGAAPTRVPARR